MHENAVKYIIRKALTRKEDVVDKENFERAKWIPIAILAVILMIVYKTIDNFSQITEALKRFFFVISPLLYGILFAYFFFIPHQKIEKLYIKAKLRFISKRARGFSTLTVFFLLVGVVALIILFVLPILIKSAVDLAGNITVYIDYIVDFIDGMPDDSFWNSLNLADTLRDSTSGSINQYINSARLEQIARGIISFAGEIANLLLGLVVSMYLLWEREKIGEFFRSLGNVIFRKEKNRERINKYLSQVNKVLFTFIASKGLDSIINFIAATTVLLIFGVPYALLLGLIAAVFNCIPYIGSIISAFIISIIALIATDLSTAVYVMLALLIFNQLDGNYIEPRIMKSSLKISPILVIIAVVIGGAYMGIVGMFLAVPVAVIIKQILQEYIAHTEAEKAAVSGHIDKISDVEGDTEADVSDNVMEDIKEAIEDLDIDI